MKGELHITLLWNPQEIQIFKNTCEFVKMKPIIIELENRHDDKYIQVMTSSVCDYNDIIVESQKFIGKAVQRIKFEIQPNPAEKHRQHIYYETHFRLKLYKGYDRDLLIKTAKVELPNCYFSKNLLKKGDSFDYQMVTYRSNEDYQKFFEEVEHIRSFLRFGNIEFDKVEIEECIYDSNTSLDDLWFKK